jgi:GNAT superfamily N-acetyltransferase
VSERVKVRPAREEDLEFIHAMILALAEYEQAGAKASGTVEMLREALFGADPSGEAAIGELDGEPVAVALFYRTFSTWECLPGIWLEDLFVLPEYRRGATAGVGVGEEMFRHLARLTVERGYTRLEWVALDWNTPALSFYEKHGAELMNDWLMHRLTGDSLRAVAEGQSGA